MRTASSTAAATSFVLELNRWTWQAIPAQLGRRRSALAAVVRDGSYLAAWPAVGALACPLALVLGFSLGLEHVGYQGGDIDYLYSLATVLVFAVLAQHGAAIGASLWLGVAIGDLLLFMPAAGERWLAVLGARLVADVVLAFLCIAIPLLTTRLTRSTLLELPIASQLRVPLAIAPQALLTVYLVFLWCRAAPVLLQTVFLWSGVSPLTHGLTAQYLAWSWGVAFAAAYAAGVRAALEPLAAPNASLAAGTTPTAPWHVIGTIATICIPAAALALVIGALITTSTAAWQTFAGVTVILSARSLVSRYLVPWSRLFARIPLVVRFVAALIVINTIAGTIVRATWGRDVGFSPVETSALVSLVVFAVLLPPQTWRRVPKSRYAVAASALFCAAFVPTDVLAGWARSVQDACQDDPRCAHDILVWAGMMAGATLPDAEPQTVTVSVDSPDDACFYPCGAQISFTATTQPPGRESEIRWSVPQGQHETTSSGSGPTFSTSWTETGVKQVVAALDCRHESGARHAVWNRYPPPFFCFPPGDAGVLRALRNLGHNPGTGADAITGTPIAESWRPWRSYAVHHLWATLEGLQLKEARDEQSVYAG